MNSAVVVDVTTSGMLTREIVKWLDNHGYLKSGVTKTLASYVINGVIVFVLTLINDYQNGITISQTLVRALAANILSAIWHELLKTARS